MSKTGRQLNGIARRLPRALMIAAFASGLAAVAQADPVSATIVVAERAVARNGAAALRGEIRAQTLQAISATHTSVQTSLDRAMNHQKHLLQLVGVDQSDRG